MTTLESLLLGILDEPLEEMRWLVLADYLEENDDPRRAELLRLHRKLLGTQIDPTNTLRTAVGSSWLRRFFRGPRRTKQESTTNDQVERAIWQARIVELLCVGVRPCVPVHTLALPGRVPLVGCFVPPGAFLMGGTIVEHEKPIHHVTLTDGFFLGAYPVTQEQWNAVVCSDPSHFKGPNRPVESVSWDDCQVFCAKLTEYLGKLATVRLPTEAEWEWACRAGTTTHYHFGDVISADLVNYNGTFTWNRSPKGKNRKSTTDVGSFPPNAWGLFDLHGNVWEWCADSFEKYVTTEQTWNMTESDNNMKILRGGSWGDNPQGCRSADRYWGERSRTDYSVGFRVAFQVLD